MCKEEEEEEIYVNYVLKIRCNLLVSFYNFVLHEISIWNLQ